MEQYCIRKPLDIGLRSFGQADAITQESFVRLLILREDVSGNIVNGIQKP